MNHRNTCSKFDFDAKRTHASRAVHSDKNHLATNVCTPLRWLVSLILNSSFSVVGSKNVDVTKQAEVDQIMLELDGTDNKCMFFIVL